MSGMSRIAAEIAELKRCGEMIINIADTFTEMLSTDENVAPQKKYTLEEVRSVLAKKSQSGHTAEVKALLTKYGVDKLSAIDPSKYEALLKDAEDIKDE
jgi:hypothetical protein